MLNEENEISPVEFWINNNFTDYSINEIIVKFDLLNKSRETNFLFRRYCFINYLKNKRKLTFEAIGNVLNKNHSTIIHSLRKYNTFMGFDTKYGKPCKVFVKSTEEIREFLKKY